MNAKMISLDGWTCSQEHERSTPDGGSVLNSVWQNAGGAILTVHILQAPDDETARGLLRSRVAVTDSLKELQPAGALGDEAFTGGPIVAFRSGATTVIIKHVHGGQSVDVLAVAQRVKQRLQ